MLGELDVHLGFSILTGETIGPEYPLIVTLCQPGGGMKVKLPLLPF